MIIQHRNFGSISNIKFGDHVNHNYGLHIHQFSELVWVMEGEIEINVDGRLEVGRKGDMFVITPYKIHDFKTPEYSRIMICVFSNDFAVDFIPQDEWYTGREGAVFTMSKELEDYVRSHLYEEAKFYPSDSGQNNLTIKAGIHAVLDEYVKAVPQKSFKKKDALQAVLIYMSQHFKEKLDLKTTAQSLGYTPGHISHCLEAIPGFNFSTLVNSLRVEYAKILLGSSDTKIIEVALESGFSCERSFHRAFKSLTGLTPMQYRAKKKNPRFECYASTPPEQTTP